MVPRKVLAISDMKQQWIRSPAECGPSWLSRIPKRPSGFEGLQLTAPGRDRICIHNCTMPEGDEGFWARLRIQMRVLRLLSLPSASEAAEMELAAIAEMARPILEAGPC